MPRYNFLDEAGLKKYHQLAGYSEIPITDYKAGSLNTENGNVISNASKRVTDYIELPIYYKYSAVVKGSGIICYYSSSGEFIEAKTFTDSVSFTLNDITKTVNISGAFMTLRAAKIRISCNMQAAVEGTKNTPFIIRSLHDNASKWLYDEIVENRGDITTNRNDIAETNKLIMRLHADYNISVTPITIEKGASNKITISNVYFKFDGNKIYPSGGYEIKRSGAAGNLPLFDGGDGSDILNNSGYLNDTISKSATYTLSMTHLGCPFTKAVSVSAYYPIIYGGSPDSSINGEYLERIWNSIGTDFYKSSGKATPSGTYTFTTQKDDYMYILVPRDEETDGKYNMTISDVKSSGFEVPMISQGLVTMTNNTNRKYNVYRSQIQVNAGQKTLVVTGSRTTIS